MPLKPFIIFILLILTTCYQFNLTGPQNKLLTWVNSMGVQQNLLLSQISVEKRTLLVKRTTFPYEFETDENCALTESLENATLYEPSAQMMVSIDYTHMQGKNIMSKDKITLTNENSIKLTDEFTLNLSTYKPLQQTQVQPSQFQNTNITQSLSELSLLYLYNDQQLLQIDSKIYSPQPNCYMLSRMTQKLCLQQNCATLSPFQLYDMEIGPLIKNFVLINGIITIPSNSTNQLIDSVVFGQIVSTKSGESITESIKINQKIITLSENTVLTVKFQLSTTNVPIPQNDLRRVGQTPSQSKYDINIIVSNPKQVFAIKTINFYKGKELILSDRIIIKPSQILTYDTQWNGDTVNLPAVEILNQKLEIEGKYSLNFEIIDQKTEQQLLGASNDQIIPQTVVEEVTIEQTHSGIKLPLIIAIAAGGVVLFLTMVLIWRCRKRIVKKCFQAHQKAEAEPEIKKQLQCDRKQSGRQLNIEYQITFQKKPQNIASLPTSSTLNRQPISASQNPQTKPQNLESSFDKQLPVFSMNPSSIILSQTDNKNSNKSSQTDNKQKSITQRVKSNDCVSREESLSLSSKWDQSYTNKRICKKKLAEKEKDQEKTEKI